MLDIYFFICYFVIDLKSRGGIYMNKIKLNKKTKNYVARLLQLQKKVIENDYTEILTKVNQILFTINEKWRHAMKKANPRNFDDYQLQQRLNNATCYKF